MTIYYHFAQHRLAAGSVIEPGNFGRLLSRYVPGPANVPGFGNPWLLCRELIFERLRPAAKPSRFGCSFALQSIDHAKIYRATNDQNCLQVLHEVEFFDEALPRHTGALSFLEMTDGVVFLEPTRQAAAAYWSGAAGTPEKGAELLTLSALRIVRALE